MNFIDMTIKRAEEVAKSMGYGSIEAALESLERNEPEHHDKLQTA